MMPEGEYNQRVSAVFKRLVSALDAVDPDLLEADATGDMVTITSSKGEKCIVNTQRAVRQVWVAGASQGIHFSLEADGHWRDDKGKGLELFAWVREVVRGMADVDLDL